ncbi:RNA 2',3'-cyclic phosphodiesterase [Marinobacterium rhizophilum]|uniref:RNA 2',3'-cyclic phosphodiesterase n=1 Tax=Marinobacterium rhizophilum TaxID=420402 RepID=UPI0003782888|nr:RNA 2',3'-cyclic phosphodiesterase [Marinobacterium rhizophilum]
MRLFVAIDLPDRLQDVIGRLQQPVRHLHWTAPERMHITLHFLGEQPAHRLEAIYSALEQIEFSPMNLRCEGVGQFASGVIWLGVDPQPSLERLQHQIGGALRAAGIPLQQRRFIPHITLGRCPSNRLSTVLEHVAARFYGQAFCFEADMFSLKSSQLRPAGALHHIEAQYLCAGG